MKTKVNRLAVSVIFFMMLMAAVIESMRGILVPSFKQLIGMNNTMVGTMLTLGSLGYVSATYLADVIRSRWGSKALMLTAVSLLIGSALSLAFTTNYPMYILGMVLMNMGLGLNSVGGNVLLPMLILTMQVFVMNSLHFMYGFGAMLGQRFSGYLVTHGVGARQLYLGVMVIYLILLALILVSRFPDEPEHEKSTLAISHFLKDRVYLLYVLGLSSYVFGEQGLAIWLTDYLKESFLIDENYSSLILSTFFILIGIGRLAGGLFVERVGRLRSVIGGMLIGVLCVTVGLLSGSRWLPLISLAGLFYSIVFPTMLVTISSNFPRSRAQAISLILTGTSALLMVYNQLLGLLADKIGYGLSIYLIPLATVLSIVFFIRLKIVTDQIKQESTLK